MHLHIESITVHRDHRGALLKIWPAPVRGEVYIVELLPGHDRGHHYHRNGGEWFAPIQGTVRIAAMVPGEEATAITLTTGQRVHVPAGVAHALRAVDGPAIVAAVADCEHQDEVTISHKVPWPCP